MTSNSQITQRRQLLLSISVLSIFACAVYFLAIPMYKASAKKKSTPATMIATTTFPTSTGLPAAIPDNVPAGLTLSIPVSGLTDQLRGVALNMTLDQPAGGGGHTWVGDLNVNLTGPPAGPTHLIMQRVGSATGMGSGDSTDIQGPYTFTDGTTGDFWALAVAMVGGTVPPGAYRTMACCTGAFTDMNPVFQGPVLYERSTAFDRKSGESSKFSNNPVEDAANGTWTLNVADNATGDTGRVSALSLTLTTLAPTAATASLRGGVFDINGQAVSNASVTIFNTETGESSVYRTNNFGYFRFDELPVGHFYTLSVQHRQHQFEVQSFTLDEDRQAEFRSNTR